MKVRQLGRLEDLSALANACRRSLNDLVKAGPKILKDNDRCVAARSAGDGTAWVRRASGLIETRNRHSVLAPTWNRPQ
jgi:hypothetical protein